MLGRDKVDDTFLTCDQGNFNQITARSRNRTLITVVRGTCTTTVPPAPHKYIIDGKRKKLLYTKTPLIFVNKNRGREYEVEVCPVKTDSKLHGQTVRSKLQFGLVSAYGPCVNRPRKLFHTSSPCGYKVVTCTLSVWQELPSQLNLLTGRLI